MLKKIIKTCTKYALIWQQMRNIASLGILENYLTDAVTKGRKMKSNQLIDIQNKLNDSEEFLKYLLGK